MVRKYRPGKRSSLAGKLVKERFAWVRTGQMAVTMYVQPTDPDEGDNVAIMLYQAGTGRRIWFTLGGTTHAEIVALRKFWNMLFDYAEPIAIKRDQIAEEAYESGDDSYNRIYREVPQFIVRGGKIDQHDESISERPGDVLGGDGTRLPSSNGVRAASDDVAEPAPNGTRAEDDLEETDFTPVFREMGRVKGTIGKVYPTENVRDDPPPAP